MSWDDDGFQTAYPADSGLELNELPFFPLTAPGLAAPGPDFLNLAVALGDPQPELVREGGEWHLVSHGPQLGRLARRALYDPNFGMQVTVRSGTHYVQFLSGHPWGATRPTGPRSCRVMIVGKWPLPEEVCLRSYFHPNAGPGRILFETIRKEFGPPNHPYLPEDGPFGYRNWYITSVVKHPNPEEGSTRVAATWLKNCRFLLQQEWRLVLPDFILAMGSEAAEAILGKGHGINATVGKVFEVTVPLHKSTTEEPVFHTAKVMTCLHPIAVGRKPDLLPQLVDGLRHFIHLIQGTRQVLPAQVRQKDHRVIYHARELEKVIEEVHADPDGDKIAVDCEWHGVAPTEPNAYLRTLQFSHKPGFAACIVLHDDMVRSDPDDWLTARDDVIPRKAFGPSHGRCRELLRKLFYDRPDGRKVRVIGHNFKADLAWLIPWGLDLRDLYAGPLDDPGYPEDPDALPGWAKTASDGGFDTMLALHAAEETADFKLEVVCSRFLGVDRWDMQIQEYRKQWCKARGISDKDLEGYGPFPGKILHPYSLDDVDYCRALFDFLNDEDGLLDRDQYGNCSRLPFWISMRATLAFLEMELNGLAVDRQRVDELTALYMTVHDRLLTNLHGLTNWADLNPASAPQCRTLLFGPAFSGSWDGDGGAKDLLLHATRMPGREHEPITALALTPVKTTGKPARPWVRVVATGEQAKYTPGTDKESLGILRAQAAEKYGPGSIEAQIVETLRQLRFVGQTLRSVLCPPTKNKDGVSYAEDEDGNLVYERGLSSFLLSDGRVRTHFYQTKETGRASSSRPPLQNLSSKREADYEAIVSSADETYRWPLRSIIKASPGYVLCEHDLAGAELFMMAVQSGDPKMIDHCQRNVLPEEGFNEKGEPDPRGKLPHPDYYDIHSSIAVQAFRLSVDSERAAEELKLPVGAICPSTKMGLKAIKKLNLRKVAKTLAFGLPYGRGLEAVVRAVEEEGVKITTDEADKLRQAIFGAYPRLEPYLAACRARATNPGWMANCFGRYRRFQKAFDKQALGEMERQAGNFNIQSGVADYVSRALDLFYHYPGRGDRFRLVLQIHDAILAEVRIEDLKWWLEEVVPACMTRIPIYRCDLAGYRLGEQPYYMGCGREIMTSWGVPLTREEGLSLGVPEIYLPSCDA